MVTLPSTLKHLVSADQNPAVERRYLLGGWPSNAFLDEQGEVLGGGTYLAPARFLEMAGKVLEGYGERGPVGTIDRVVDRLREIEAIGFERVMLQHLAHDDLETVALIGRELAPAVA